MLVSEIKKIIEDEGLDYGTVWSEEKLIRVFNIKKPDVSSRNANTIIENVKRFELKKMEAYSMLNEQLLNYGMCFVKDKNNYRVPLINEMTEHIDKYYKASNKKFYRAEKLRKSFSKKYPAEAKANNDKASKTIIARLNKESAYKPLR